MIAELLRIFWRSADIAIGGAENPYLLRWFVIPRNPWFNIMLHEFVRDDDDRALHDHPWWFVSFLFWGQYDEIVSDSGIKVIYRNSPSVAFRRAEHRHRIVLVSKSAWTLVITGPRVREWGFWCPKGFVNWRDFTTGTHGERIGKGCD